MLLCMADLAAIFTFQTLTVFIIATTDFIINQSFDYVIACRLIGNARNVTRLLAKPYCNFFVTLFLQ